ncbi:unnamed protein product [Caenorhabditis bovis]|uniref:Uncharacterized protein n=1 Tax=Caenorhabditis bovis TaxID=2654633 RepID=A0A8S1F5J7_9PELO|nr:unnamed protein product [Caenorhabditis bovis]
MGRMDEFLKSSLDVVPKEICKNGMCLNFAVNIAKICEEIRQLYEIEESVRVPTSDNIEEFLYDLSAFLLELECGHEELSNGDILTRFELSEKCEILLNFLVSELKTARLYALNRYENTKKQKRNADKELTPLIEEVLNVLEIPKQSCCGDPNRLLESIKDKAESRRQNSQRLPILRVHLNDQIIQEIEKICEKTTRDYNNRLLLLTTRLKVTVESFLWSDRLKPVDAKIREILARRLAEIQQIKSNCDISHVLSGSTALLVVKKASDPSKRANTKCLAHPLSQGGPPKDRGGRTDEMMGLRNETFAQQQAQRVGERRGGGFRGGRGRGRGGHRGQSYEQQVGEQKLVRPCLGQFRPSTTAAFKHLDKLVIESPEDALEIASRLTIGEQNLLKEALETCAHENGKKSLELTPEQVKGLFLVNSIPFIGFGLLDNMIMILAGEYIDQQLGAVLCISTMAAAALGNLISDIAGVGLAHYVEVGVQKVGIKHPVLTAAQLESPKARFSTNCARAAGLTIGCLLGMFPLMFFESEDEKEPETSSKL